LYFLKNFYFLKKSIKLILYYFYRNNILLKRLYTAIFNKFYNKNSVLFRIKFGFTILTDLEVSFSSVPLHRSKTLTELNKTMKTNYKSIIFAVVFGSVFNSNIATAINNDTTKKVQSVATISNGHEKSFETFVNQNLPKFVEQEDWKKITNIVTLYNLSPSKLLNVDTKSRKAFNEAVAKLSNNLTINGSEESQAWFNRLENTARTINFIWNKNWNNLEDENTNTDSAVVVASNQIAK
jgi:hypothetical protein